MRYKSTYLQNRNRLTDLDKKLGCREEGYVERIVREFGIYNVHTAIFKMDNNKDLLCSKGKSAQCYVAAWMGGKFRGEWIHVYVYVWLSPFVLHLKLSQHCQSAIL